MSDNTQRQDIEKYEEFSFAHLQEKHPLGAELLGICALLATEDIPEELFIQGASVFGGNLQDITQSPHVWEQAIEDLLVYKLIERQASTHTLRISPSVQSTLLDVLSLDEQQRRVEQLLRALHSLVSSSSNTSLPQFVLHIQQIAKLSESWTLSFPEAAEVFSWAAKDLYEQKLYESAELLLKRALAIYTLVYGKTHLIVIMVLDDLVNLYKAQKNYTEAQRLLLRIFLSRMQVLGQEHPDTISTLCDMGDVYAIQGKREEAETLYKKALTNSELMLGSEHSIIVTVLDSLATLYLEWPDATNTEGNEKTNSSTETDGLPQGVTSLWERVRHTSDPETAVILQKLALIYMRQENWEQAEIAFQRVLQVYESSLGAVSLEAAQCLEQMAVLYSQQERFDEVEAALTRVVALKEQVLGSEHLDVAAGLNNLAAIYLEQEKYEQAEPYFQRALVISTNSSEPEMAFPVRAMSLSSLASVYLIQEKNQQALSLLEQAYVVLEQTLGSEHPDVIALQKQYQELMALDGANANDNT